jgi:hypothetical protein
MRTLALALLLPFAAQAAPFLVMDVQPEADSCTVVGLPAAINPTATEVGGQCKIDLAGIPVGSYTVTTTANNMWETSGPTVPFVFRRPVSISMPAGLRLVP